MGGGREGGREIRREEREGREGEAKKNHMKDNRRSIKQYQGRPPIQYPPQSNKLIANNWFKGEKFAPQ